MELLEFKDRFLRMLETDKVEEVPEILNRSSSDLIERYQEEFGTDRDWIREFYQYYLADREGLKQDYTPPSLSKLLLHLVGPCRTLVDLCAGTGSLSLYADPDTKIKAIELDPKAAACLRFNYAVHGLDAEVVQADALTFLTDQTKADGAISNPPFNIQPASLWPPANTGNWSFVLSALDRTARRAAVILPAGILNETKDKSVVRSLLQSGRLKAVIKCPEKMFLSTSIPVCVLVLSHEPADHVMLIDASRLASKEVREQRGQYGGTSHTGRIYRKELNVLNDQAIENITKAVNYRLDTDFSTFRSADLLIKNDCRLSPGLYLNTDPDEQEQTKLEWIAERYNSIVRQKNACKLTINETLAKELGFEKDLWEQQKKNSDEVANMIQKLSGIKLESEDYLTFTRSRELTIRFKSKEVLPEIFTQFMQMWVNRVVLLNNLENEMLAQMRDYLLPKLMSGEIEIPERRKK
ncbi:N-6 DNA methylase [Allobaculum fili]|uniref:N-6 DNA methylase n=1 Tax=Allobaculum fili TaxID=2834460 RepID=UPI0034E25AC9